MSTYTQILAWAGGFFGIGLVSSLLGALAYLGHQMTGMALSFARIETKETFLPKFFLIFGVLLMALSFLTLSATGIAYLIHQ